MSKEIYKLAGLATIFAGIGGLLYTIYKDTVILQETARLQYEISLMRYQQECERWELAKYNLGLPSKFDKPLPTFNKVDTPVSDNFVSKLSNSKVLDNIHDLDNKFKNGANSPFEDYFSNKHNDFDYDSINLVSPEMINYAGITILGCVVVITSALIALYMNHLVTHHSEKYIQSCSPVVLKLYKLYKNSVSVSSMLLKLNVLAFYLLMVSTCCYMINL